MGWRTRLDTGTTESGTCGKVINRDFLARVITISIFTLMIFVATVPLVGSNRAVSGTHVSIQEDQAVALVVGSTSTSVSCNPTVVINQASTCTATVSNIGTSITTPTGSVIFVATVQGSFSPTSSCNLAPASSAGTASCSASFTPFTAGTTTLTGNYNGDLTHSTSSGTSNVITVSQRNSITTISCSTSALIGNPDACRITIIDNSPGTPIIATGSFPLVTNNT